jgi:hypothetical protein
VEAPQGHAVAAHQGPVELDGAATLDEGPEDLLALGPGEVGAEAVVDARGEAHGRALVTGDVEAVRLREVVGVSVGRPEQGHHVRADGDGLAGEVGRLERGAHVELHR